MTLDELREWAESAPDGTMLPAARLVEFLEDLDRSEGARVPPPTCDDDSAPPTWRERLWTVDAEVRLGRNELLEAVGRPSSWLYRHTGPSATHRIPHRKLDGQLVFVVGEVRRWLRRREELVQVGPGDGAVLQSIAGGRS